MCLLLFLVSIIYIFGSECCHLTVKIRSLTDKPFLFQIIVPAIRKKTNLLKFTKRNEERITVIKGENCNAQHWIFRTWRYEDDKPIPVHENRVKIEGTGYYQINIWDDVRVHGADRDSIFCSEGIC
ncbi:hypothetical protein AB6A40_000471 [Gnathostoma spinigerum]|uniref:Uncharacterized protein n=1 Tax=Gnathostoma spinigerum TaxID=75299 RepID=A0ABD6EBA3_9BILA